MGLFSSPAQDGKLQKLTFVPYKDITFGESDKGKSYSVMINPNNIAVKLQVEWDEKQADGATNATMKFKRIQPQDYSFEFIIDGTGATGQPKDVPQDIDQFLSTIYDYNSTEHKPNYLKITYGSILLKCILKTVDITYNLFTPNAKPLRAKINATFASCADPVLMEAQKNSNSPDMTHLRKLTRSDKLIGISNNIYKNNIYYLEVARANNLDTFRNLTEGTEVFFPPISKT